MALLLLPTTAVYAAVIQSNGTGGGIWSATSTWSGGTVPTDFDDVTILNGDTVDVDSDATRRSSTTVQTSGILRIVTGGRIFVENGSTLTNDGTLDILDTLSLGDGELRNGATGTVALSPGSSIFIFASGSVVNEIGGVVTFESIDAQIFGSFDNRGAVELLRGVSGGGNVDVGPEAVFTNSGTIEVSAALRVFGSSVNTGTINLITNAFGSGTVTVTSGGEFSNTGIVNISSSTSFSNGNRLSNSGTINNGGFLTSQNFSDPTTIITNESGGIINNLSGGSISLNTGVLENLGSMSNSGSPSLA